VLQEQMIERFSGRMYISKSLPYFLEFAGPEVSKGSGLAFLAERLGFTAAQTVAVGDGENDRELLDWGGYAVCVEDSHASLFERADLVIPGPESEGVADLIESYLDSSL
jgi:hydroxymethylpyrimidine pyrophosphatase-like HAD family hydrolase